MAIMRINLNSRCLKRKNDVTVYLPVDLVEDYRLGRDYCSENVRFPVLWLLHGGWGDDTDFRDYTGIMRYAEAYHLALVMPGGIDFYKEPYFGYVTQELPRQLAGILPLSRRREDNFICGLSFGGDCAMRACLEYPGQYQGGLVMSAAGTDHHGEAKMRFDAYGMAQGLLDSNERIPELIFATGSGDRGFPYYLPVIQQLEQMGLPVKRHFVEGDGHSWNFWDETVRTVMAQWFADRVQKDKEEQP